ncbi:hypothetical protein, conserved [Trypanosoma brucei gambiense DAL972]|uniref:Uncharacterized protein n=1 Tax=Trypanosoma brucei gambiense (strain MHOM/CI/86/DAL972) TaxID=679716 RepID=D0A0H5_TRYB9|nr:hypothetical protein, conserved [Trypanosoma brucei gambiense DAL972]CBH16733.1 hypothetical protein, conserved [Trypanosoma brucei gambiense DAL972]|eukprot:XP_011778997.1 hypothetical protein, conserved [Trypanosoma brucei gambiense DAL972]
MIAINLFVSLFARFVFVTFCCSSSIRVPSFREGGFNLFVNPFCFCVFVCLCCLCCCCFVFFLCHLTSSPSPFFVFPLCMCTYIAYSFFFPIFLLLFSSRTFCLISPFPRYILFWGLQLPNIYIYICFIYLNGVTFPAASLRAFKTLLFFFSLSSPLNPSINLLLHVFRRLPASLQWLHLPTPPKKKK